RSVRICLGGVIVANTHRPLMLLETGLPIRYYIPEQDVSMVFLEPTETTSRCPYKGKATYWTARIEGRIFEDIMWSYQEPLPACMPVERLICFFYERVDAIYVNDELLPKPVTPWSE
ncbi:MAG TPA: DUF427 domain-containing protein, partial [Ktedonobacteraceae bacterium]